MIYVFKKIPAIFVRFMIQATCLHHVIYLFSGRNYMQSRYHELAMNVECIYACTYILPVYLQINWLTNFSSPDEGKVYVFSVKDYFFCPCNYVIHNQ